METIYKIADFKLTAKMLFADKSNKLDHYTRYSKFGDVIEFSKLHCHYLINDPNTIHQILVSNVENYTKENTSFSRFQDMLGIGQLTTSGEAWADSRKKVQKNFYYNNLAQTVDVINECTDNMLDEWEKKFLDKRKYMDIKTEATSLSLNIFSSVLFGKKFNYNIGKTAKILQFVNEYAPKALSFRKYTPTLGNFRYQRAKKYLNNLCSELLQGSHNEVPNLSPLLAPFFVTDKDDQQHREKMLGEAKNFLLSSHETMASTLTWTIYCLGNSQPSHEILLNEVRTVLQGRAPTFEDYNKLEFAQKTVKEALRLYPPLWSLERRAIDDDQFGPLKCKKNSIVFTSTYTLHRSPKYWDDPDSFNPSRFDEHTSQNRPKCAYIPFGMGPRACIGQHIAMLTATLVISKIVQRYHFQLHPKQKIQAVPMISLKQKPTLKVRIQSLLS